MGLVQAIDTCLKNQGKAKTRRIGLVLFSFVVLVDLSTVFLLREAPALIVPPGTNLTNSTDDSFVWFVDDGMTEEDYQVSWDVEALMDGLHDFRTDTVDVCLLTIVRICLLMILLRIGVWVGTPKLHDIDTSSVAPLLINQGTDELHELASEAKKSHLESHKRKKAADIKKNIIVGLMFVISSTAQIYLGVKVISFSGHWTDHNSFAVPIKTMQGILFFAVVVIINVESFLANRLVNTLCSEDGFYVPEFHQHRLFFHVVDGHVCDMCHNRARHMYRCEVCDFDACPACFNKKDKATGEGVMRGDQGVRDVLEIGRMDYLWRGARLIWPHLPLFLFALLCLLLQSCASLVLPNFQGQIFDHIIEANHVCKAEPGSGECTDHEQGFYHVMVMYLILSIVLGALQALRALSFQIVARRIAIWVRVRLFRIMIRQDIAFFDGMRTGDLQSRLSNDISTMVQPIYTTLSTVLSNLTLLIGGVVMCFTTSWRLSMLAFTTILPMMHITGVYADWSKNINKQIYQHLSDAMSRMGEAVSNIRTVRACSSEEIEAKRNDHVLHRALLAGIRDAIAGGIAAALNDYLDLLAGVLILWYGGSIAMDPGGAISTGQLITYQLYWNMINTSIQALNDMVNSFTRAAGAAERVLSLYDLEPDIDPDKGMDVEVAVNRWSIEFDQVEFHYQMRPQQKVLQGMSFKVEAGNVAALVGRSGGGKSTMVHLLLRFYDPRAGRILLGGADLRELHIASMHKHIGVVSQETQLFNSSIGENISYGIEGEVSNSDIVAAAKAAQAFQFISEFEDGLSTRVGERGTRLSGGQKQRIAIARCLLRKPKLLLLDEATSALDAESEALVQKALDALIWTGEHTVVLVAHRLSTVINAHTIVVVDKGRAAEQGTHEELLNLNGTYAALVAHQVQKQREQLSENGPTPKAQSFADGIDGLFSRQDTQDSS